MEGRIVMKQDCSVLLVQRDNLQQGILFERDSAASTQRVT